MQVGRVVLILSEDDCNVLLSILKASKEIELMKLLDNARRTIFIDDFRPDRIGVLPD